MHTILPNLPQTTALYVLYTLRGSLPRRPDASAEELEAREAVAIQAVADLLPANTFEALLAVQIVAADAHVQDSLRSAIEHAAEPDRVLRCEAQAANMMRTMHRGLQALQRTQAERAKAEAAMHPPAMERAGYWFRDVSVPAPEEEPGEPAPPPEATLAFEAMSEAEQYAVIYPERAALIRAHGGMPPHASFGPPSEALVAALVQGSSPVLQRLDRSEVSQIGNASCNMGFETPMEHRHALACPGHP